MTKVLIVDDGEENLYLLQKLLEGHGYIVDSAQNGAQALQSARRNPPGLIVSDILMPVMDGFSLCREWKNDPILKKIPFVFFTATYTDSRDEKFALGLGADRFIAKPIEPEDLLKILNAVVADHQEGRLAVGEPVGDETVHFKQYNEVLFRKLEGKILQLEQSGRNLDQCVKDQETQIRERTSELQRVVNLMADREIRMRELKAKIRQLRAQLEKAGLPPEVDDASLYEAEDQQLVGATLNDEHSGTKEI